LIETTVMGLPDRGSFRDRTLESEMSTFVDKVNHRHDEGMAVPCRSGYKSVAVTALDGGRRLSGRAGGDPVAAPRRTTSAIL